MTKVNATLNADLNPTFRKTWSRRPPGAPATPQAIWNGKSRDKLEAHAAVRVALRQGLLRRGNCEICGSFRVDAHHENYSRPLEVRWLCRRHHQALHAEIRRAGQ
jgi:hypothetical protein